MVNHLSTWFLIKNLYTQKIRWVCRSFDNISYSRVEHQIFKSEGCEKLNVTKYPKVKYCVRLFSFFKVSYVNEVAMPSSQTQEGFTEIPLKNEPIKDAETNHNSITTTNNHIKSTEKENCVSTPAVKESGDADQELNTKPEQLEDIKREKNDLTRSSGKSGITCPRQEDYTEPESSDTERNSDMKNQDVNETDKNSENLKNNESAESGTNASKEATSENSDIPTECEKQEPENEENNDTEVSSEESSQVKEIENPTVLSEKYNDEKGLENPAVDVSATEPPSLVIIPASPEVEIALRLDMSTEDDGGNDNPAFEVSH